MIFTFTLNPILAYIFMYVIIVEGFTISEGNVYVSKDLTNGRANVTSGLINSPFACVCPFGPVVSRGDHINCNGTLDGGTCDICCDVGYKANLDPICRCGENADVIWVPERVYCEPVSDCIRQFSYIWGREMTIIPISSCHGELYYGLTFDMQRRLPFYAVNYFTKKNVDGKKCQKRWRKFTCEDELIHASQFVGYEDLQNYRKTQLANNIDVGYNDDAARSTFRYINAVPQDLSAEAPWTVRENLIRKQLSEKIEETEIRNGLVITGACLTHHYYNDVLIPDCIWKLVCTRTDRNEWTVVGFYHRNRLSSTSIDDNERIREIREMRNQRVFGHEIGIDTSKLWTEASQYFEDFDIKDTIMQCKDASSIEFPTPWEPEGNDLFQFWNKTNGPEMFDQEMQQIDSFKHPKFILIL